MNHSRILTIMVGLIAFAPNGRAAQTTVSVLDCGTRPIIAEGSSPYSGSIRPDPSTHKCSIYFSTPGRLTPFLTVVDGTTEDHVGPVCTTQIQGPRASWSVRVTSAGIGFSWQDVHGLSVSPKWISWICEYPWQPN